MNREMPDRVEITWNQLQGLIYILAQLEPELMDGFGVWGQYGADELTWDEVRSQIRQLPKRKKEREEKRIQKIVDERLKAMSLGVSWQADNYHAIL